ncbi:MAG: hypothetical protein ACTHM6_18010 [Tepidisphaeraceae bacterium]
MPLLWRIALITCLLAIAVAGIDWGLPSSKAAPYLASVGQQWSGQRLAGFDADRTDAKLGADVDRNPVSPGDTPVVLNRTDAQRAEILRRYRLYSHQPDEMITFMALQQMNPAQRQFDPRLYQYGGLWIYPVGGLLKGASMLGLIDLRPDKAFYYDHPEAFGRFYVVARLYTLLAYVGAMALGAMVVKRLSDDDFAAAVTAAVIGALPVVFALAHDAKPHLGGAALMLAACLAGARWVRTNATRDAILVGLFVGLASGMVLSAAVVVIVPVAMVLLGRATPGERVAALLLALSMGAFVYAATNPYVLLHLINHDPVLASNASNTKAMYALQDLSGPFLNAARLTVQAMSIPMVSLAGISTVVVIARRRALSPLAILILATSLAVAIPFVLFAEAKPSEYARFSVFPVMALAILCLFAVTTTRRTWVRYTTLTLLPILLIISGTLPYIQAFAADTGDQNTRQAAAAAIQLNDIQNGATLQMYAEPAPYSVPPANVFDWRMVLTRPADPAIGDVVIRAIDDPDLLGPVPMGYRRQVIGADDRLAPITWADKPFEILTKQ